MAFNFTSLYFLIIIIILFYCLRPSWRVYILAFAGAVYAYLADPATMYILCLLTLVIYLSAGLAESAKKRSLDRISDYICAAAVCLSILSLVAFKLYSKIGSSLTGGDPDAAKILVPLGFSYYIFQAVSYMLDVRNGLIPAEKNPVKLLLYFAYFPKLSSGPIERYSSMKSDIEALESVRFFNGEMWEYSISYILTGLFFKLMIADRLSGMVDKIFSAPDAYSPLWLILGSLAFTVQIYADFAGYSYLAMGISNLFGIRLTLNFNAPYMSSNITEFWRRWHISLSTFLKDYLYIPLGGNRKGSARKILNTFIVFLVCGLWHGIGFGFLFWGFLHGAYSALDIYIREKNMNRIRTGVLGRIITFIGVSFAWIFFKTNSIGQGLQYVYCIFANISKGITFMDGHELLKRNALQNTILIISCLIMITLDIIMYRKKCDISGLSARLPLPAKSLLFVILTVAIIILGVYGPDSSKELLYAQF